MAEVDGIILAQLKTLTGSISTSIAKVASLTDIDNVLFYNVVFHCISGIDHGVSEGLEPSLPNGRSKRFQACSDIAGTLQTLGYPNEVTFNQFMYPTESDMRDVLNWLFQQSRSEEAVAAKPRTTATTTASDSALIENAWHHFSEAARSYIDTNNDRKRETKIAYPPIKGIFPQTEGKHSVAISASRVYEKVKGEELRPFLAPTTDEEDAWCEANVPAVARQPLDKQVEVLLLSLNSYNASLVSKERIQERELQALGGSASKKEIRQRKKELRAELLAVAEAEKETQLSPTFRTAKRMAKEAENAPAARSKFLKEQSYNTRAAVDAPIEADDEGEAKEAAPLDKETEEEIVQRKKDTERKALKKRLRETAQAAKAAVLEADRLETELVELEATKAQDVSAVKEVGKDGDHMEAMLNTFTSALELCDDEGGQEKLGERLQEAIDSLAQLQADWEVKEAKLLTKYEVAKEDYEAATLKTHTLVEDLAEAKAALKELRTEVKAKTELRDQLEREAEAVVDGADREYYAGRIVLLNKNLMKEHGEVMKISEQSREMIEEYSGLQAGLTKAFATTEEACYTETKKLDSSNVSFGVAVYQEIISLKESFTALIGTVEHQAQVRQLIHEVSEKSEKQATRNASLNTEAVQADLAAIKGENKDLSKELKELRQQIKQML